jgi:hypothetical protein
VQMDDQLVVQLAGVGGRRAGVEQVAGDQHRIVGLRLDLVEQPVDQRLVFACRLLPMKCWPRCQSDGWWRRCARGRRVSKAAILSRTGRAARFAHAGLVAVALL